MRRNTGGFTLVELILVMAIIGILAVIGIGSYTQATTKSKDTQRKNDLNQISKAIESFNNDIGRYPKVAGGEMTCPNENGEEVDCAGSIYAYIGDTRSRYMTDVPDDPTQGKDYVYVPDSSFGSYALYAALENLEDRDVVENSEGDKTDWGISCGNVNCNYKLTETGLIRVNE